MKLPSGLFCRNYYHCTYLRERERKILKSAKLADRLTFISREVLVSTTGRVRPGAEEALCHLSLCHILLSLICNHYHYWLTSAGTPVGDEGSPCLNWQCYRALGQPLG